jgi:hypothetical protein
VGGEGSGRRPEKPITKRDLDWLYRDGLQEQLRSGAPGAQVEFLVRLDELKLRHRISLADYRELVKGASARRAAAVNLDLAKRQDKVIERLLKRLDEAETAVRGRSLRDVGPPPDMFSKRTPSGCPGGEPAPGTDSDAADTQAQPES